MFGYSLLYMDKNMISTAIIPIAEQYNFTTSQTGLMMSLFFLGYSLMQIPGGWLADKIGYKKVLVLSLSLITVFTFAFGFAGSLILFVLIRFFAGVGHAGYPSSTSKSISVNFSKNRPDLYPIPYFIYKWNWRNLGVSDWGKVNRFELALCLLCNGYIICYFVNVGYFLCT